MKKFFAIILSCSFIYTYSSYCQGITNIWQLGYNSGVLPKCYLDFTSGSPVSNTFNRPMNFRAACTSICNDGGNLLFYTNGVYIANALHDTMMNGSNLSPSPFTTSWISDGLPIFQGVLALPWPDSTHKYMIFHETLKFDTNGNYRPEQLLYSVVDMNLNVGLGGVMQKNTILVNDTLEIGMLSACKHANGRDWWVFAKKFISDKYFRILFTPAGIANIDTISVGGPISMYGGQSAFSPDGNWFVTYDNLSKVRIYNFDRCNGNLYNYIYYPIADPYIGGGVSFSPNSERLYLASSRYLYQLDLTSTNITGSQILIDEVDSTYYSPWPPYIANFWYLMMGSDGRIYINSQASVVDLHVINSPDNLGVACDLQQHSLYLGAFNKSTLPNHVNYYLGCDTTLGCPCLTTGNEEIPGHDFKISISPNPTTGRFKVFYLLPQNEPGELKIYDVNGRLVSIVYLPAWSTIQTIELSSQRSGIYTIVMDSKGEMTTKKLVLINSD